MRSDRQPRIRWLFIVVSVVLALAHCTHADDSQQLYDRLLAPLRRAPTDDNAVAQLSRWAADHGGIAPLAEHLERGATGVDSYLAGRFWEAAAAPARAFVAFERSLAASDANSTTIADVTRLRLTRLCLTSRWRERAREVWAAGPPLALPPIDRWEIEIRLHAGDPARIRELLAQAIADVPLETAAAWAIEEGHYLEAAALYLEKDRAAEAFRVYLDAADGHQATELYRTVTWRWGVGGEDVKPAPIKLSADELALLQRLVPRDAWEQTFRDLVPLSDQANAGSSVGRNPSVSRADSADLAAGPTAKDAAPGQPSRTPDARVSLALEVLADPGGRSPDGRDATIHRLSLRTSSPSLAVCLALLALDAEFAARREFALWQLEPNERDRAEYLPRVWRQRQDWDVTLENEIEPLTRAEVMPSPSDSDPPRLMQSRARLVIRLSEAIVRSAPNSAREAQLYYHRGRLSSNPADIARAISIAAPSAASATPVRVREVTPLGSWQRLLTAQVLNPPRAFALRFLDSDQIVGVSAGRALRIARSTRALFSTAIRLVEWRMDPDPSLAEIEKQLGLRLEPNRLLGPEGAVWNAGPLTPLTGVLCWQPNAALVSGMGVAVLKRNGNQWSEDWRLESDQPMSLTTLAPELKERLGFDKQVLELCASIALPQAPEIAHVIESARLRAGDPNLQVTAWIVGASGAVLRMADGMRAVFELAAPAETPSHREFDGYRATSLRSDSEFEAAAPAFWVREEPALEQLLSESGAIPPRIFDAEFRRVWQRSAPETTLERRESWPLGPEPPTRIVLPDFLAAESIVTELRTDQRRIAAVTTGGHVLFWQQSSSAPRWIADLRTPLPGPDGFPTAPPELRDDENSQPSRGPHLAGVTSAANTPRLWYFAAEDELVVLTDLVQRVVAASSDQPRIELVPTPHATRWTRFADVARTRYGALCLLPATTKSDELWIGADRIALPRTGAFDLEIAGEQLYVFGFADGEYWLAAQRLSEATPIGTDAFTLLPLPELPVETDRAFVRLCALGRWHDELLVLGRDLLALDTRTSPSSWRVIISARTAWPDQDLGRSFFYVQTPPTVINDELRFARPWGVVEGWKTDP